MRLKIGVESAGDIKAVAKQALRARYFHVMYLPIVPLGAVWVTGESGKKQQGVAVPFFSKLGLLAMLLAFSRRWLFLWGVIALVVIYRSEGHAAASQWTIAAVSFGLWALSLWLGDSSEDEAYEQLLFGLGSGVAARPEWLSKVALPALCTELERRLVDVTQKSASPAELAALIRARAGGTREVAVAYALARCRNALTPNEETAALSSAALDWARGRLPLDKLREQALDSRGALRLLGAVDAPEPGEVDLGDQHVWLNAEGGTIGAGIALASEHALFVATLEKARCEEALRSLKAGQSAAQVLGASATEIPFDSIVSIEAYPSMTTAVIKFGASDPKQVQFVAATVKQREALLSFMRERLGSRFAESKRPEGKAAALIGAGFTIGVVSLLGFLGREVEVLPLLACGLCAFITYRTIKRLRAPVMVTYLERVVRASQAPGAAE